MLGIIDLNVRNCRAILEFRFSMGAVRLYVIA